MNATRLVAVFALLALGCGDPGAEGGGSTGSGTTAGTTMSTGSASAPMTTASTTMSGSVTGPTTTSSSSTGPDLTSSTGPGETSSSGEPTDCVSANIQDELDVAGDGDTVTICNGMYMLDLPLIVGPGVTLAGQSTDGVTLQQLTNTDTAESGTVVTINGSDGARVTSLTLRGPASADQYAGIFVQNSDDVRIDNVAVYDFAREGFGYGVVIVGSVDAIVIEESYFEHNRHGITCDPDGGVTNNIYRNNTLVNQTDAAIDNHANSTGTQVLDNMITQGEDSTSDADGIILQGLVDFEVAGNTIDMGPQSNGRHGIVIQYVPSVATQTELTGSITGNTITNLGNTTGPGSILGVAILGDDAALVSHEVVLSDNMATGAGMDFAYYWQSPAGLVSDVSDIPDTTATYP